MRLKETSLRWSNSETHNSHQRLIKHTSMKSKFKSTMIMMFRVHLRARPVDKTNHKKKNPFASYVNSTFNAGIYLNTWADQENH